jgi:hypothetical protein
MLSSSDSKHQSALRQRQIPADRDRTLTNPNETTQHQATSGPHTLPSVQSHYNSSIKSHPKLLTQDT